MNGASKNQAELLHVWTMGSQWDAHGVRPQDVVNHTILVILIIRTPKKGPLLFGNPHKSHS